MDNKSLIAEARFVAINNHLDVDDLLIMLEITAEDLLERFEDRLLEHHDKFVPEGYTYEEEDYTEVEAEYDNQIEEE